MSAIKVEVRNFWFFYLLSKHEGLSTLTIASIFKSIHLFTILIGIFSMINCSEVALIALQLLSLCILINHSRNFSAKTWLTVIMYRYGRIWLELRCWLCLSLIWFTLHRRLCC